MPIFERVNKKLSFGYSERESDVSIEIQNYRQMNILFFSGKCCTVRPRWQIRVSVEVSGNGWNEMNAVCEVFFLSFRFAKLSATKNVYLFKSSCGTIEEGFYDMGY